MVTLVSTGATELIKKRELISNLYWIESTPKAISIINILIKWIGFRIMLVVAVPSQIHHPEGVMGGRIFEHSWLRSAHPVAVCNM